MPNMDIVGGKYLWSRSVSSAGTISETLQTQNSFIDKNIDLMVTTPAGAQTFTGGALTAGAGATTFSSNGLSNGSSIDASKKVLYTDTNANGYYEVQASGSGTVSRGAVNKQVTTAGFFSADGSPVQVIASTSKSSNVANKKVYIKQSTLSASTITPATSAQTVTVGEGYYHENRQIYVAPMAGTTVTTSLDSSGMSTYFDVGTSQNHDISITPLFSNPAGFVDAHTDSNNGGIEYYNIKDSSITTTKTTVNGTTATRGTYSESIGWKNTTETLNIATFANTATSGTTYVDISATTSAPVLVENDYLYINEGWTDALKISLAKLVPDGSDVKGHSEYILSGHSARDDDGTLIAGSIPTYAGAYVVN